MQFSVKLYSLQPFDRENKPKAASLQSRAVCLDQLFNGDNKPTLNTPSLLICFLCEAHEEVRSTKKECLML